MSITIYRATSRARGATNVCGTGPTLPIESYTYMYTAPHSLNLSQKNTLPDTLKLLCRHAIHEWHMTTYQSTQNLIKLVYTLHCTLHYVLRHYILRYASLHITMATIIILHYNISHVITHYMLYSMMYCILHTLDFTLRYTLQHKLRCTFALHIVI